MRFFIGIDCAEDHLMIGFVSPHGILKGLSTSSSAFDMSDKIGQRLYGMIRGLRGCENLRMNNFQAIGIGIPNQYMNAGMSDEIKKQLGQLWDISVFMEDRSQLAEKGNNWFNSLEHLELPKNVQQLNLGVVYGAAKLAMDNTANR